MGFLQWGWSSGQKTQDTSFPPHRAPKRTYTGVLPASQPTHPVLRKGMPAGLWILLIFAPEWWHKGRKLSPPLFILPPAPGNSQGSVAPGAEQSWVLGTRQGSSTSYQPDWPEILQRWLLDTPPSCEGRQTWGSKGREMEVWSISRNLALELLKCSTSQQSPIRTTCC